MCRLKKEAEALAIIIPAWRDTAVLRGTLNRLREQGLAERVTVALGERDEGAIGEAAKVGAAWVLAPTKGRGPQMNAGAENATGEILLFLHADTHLASGAAEAIQEALDDGCVGGAFARRFDHPGWFLRATCWLADWRGRCCGWFLGDQAIFARRDVFETLGGFREWDAFEDLDFSRRLRRVGKTRLLRPAVISSARRFQRRGAVLQTLSDGWQTLKYVALRRF